MFRLYLYSVIISGIIQYGENFFADDKIANKGIFIRDDRRSTKDIIMSFIKDYGYTLIPFVNLFRSWNLLKDGNKKYTEKRLAKLKEYSRIKVEKNDEGKQVEVKKEKSKKITPIKDDMFSKIQKEKNIEVLRAIKKECKENSTKLRQEYASIKDDPTKSLERKTIVKKVTYYDQVFIAARDRITSLKNTHFTFKANEEDVANLTRESLESDLAEYTSQYNEIKNNNSDELKLHKRALEYKINMIQNAIASLETNQVRMLK